MEKKGFLYWVVNILLIIWQLPQYLVGLVMWPFLGKKTLVAERHFNRCYSGTKMSGGISLGPIAYVSVRMSQKPPYVAHELDGHTVQSKILGPLYLLIIGLPSLVCAAFINDMVVYNNVYTEKWANDCAGLISTETGGLDFKDNYQDPQNKTYMA